MTRSILYSSPRPRGECPCPFFPSLPASASSSMSTCIHSVRLRAAETICNPTRHRWSLGKHRETSASKSCAQFHILERDRSCEVTCRRFVNSRLTSEKSNECGELMDVSLVGRCSQFRRGIPRMVGRSPIPPAKRAQLMSPGPIPSPPPPPINTILRPTTELQVLDLLPTTTHT